MSLTRRYQVPRLAPAILARDYPVGNPHQGISFGAKRPQPPPAGRTTAAHLDAPAALDRP
jgi:hypothetical protein